MTEPEHFSAQQRAMVYRCFRVVRDADAAALRELLARDSMMEVLRRTHDSFAFVELMADYALPRYQADPDDRYECFADARPAWVTWAARTGDVPTVSTLLEYGSEVSERLFQVDEYDRSYGTPLHEAIRRRHLEVAMYLIDAGANVNRDSWRSGTPLRLGRAVGDARLLRRLAEAGAR